MLAIASGVGNIKVINLLINNGVQPTEIMLSQACLDKNTDVAQRLAKELIPGVMQALNLDVILTELKLPPETVQTALATIAEKTIAHINVDNLDTLAETGLRDAVLNQLQTLVSDKASDLGSRIQHHNNPKLDKLLGIVPKKFSAYKAAFQELKTPQETAKKEDLQDNKFNPNHQ